ncbi:MAG: hypothetical protein AB1798_19845, partial [Spirochaetota bacterium]
MKKLFLAALISPVLFFSTVFVFPETTAEPEDPGIVLPPMLLEIDDLYKEAIEAVLPDQEALLSVDIPVTLPEAPKLAFDIALDVPMPKVDLSLPVQGRGSAFFTEGTIGIGSMNHIIGDITLYKLGKEPRFSLQFSHERLDGYGFDNRRFRPAGAGFFHQANNLNGNFSLRPAPFTFETDGDYTEEVEGLQAQSTNYTSIAHRFLSGTSSLTFNSGLFTVSVGLNVQNVTMTLSGMVPKNDGEFLISPRLKASVVFSSFSAGIEGAYSFQLLSGSFGNQSHGLNALVQFRAELPLALTLEGKAGIDWLSSVNPTLFPFNLSLSGIIRDLFTFRISGGYKVENRSYFNIWKVYPFLSMSLPAVRTNGWFTGLSFKGFILKTLTLDFAGDFDYFDDRLTTGGGIDPVSGLYPMGVTKSSSLGFSAGVSWAPVRIVKFSFFWKGKFLDILMFEPKQSFQITFAITNGKENLGTGLSGLWRITDTPQIPELNLNGFLRVSEGVKFSLDVFDFLSPLTKEGRRTWGVYEDPG